MLNRSYQIRKYWRCKKGLSGKLPGSFRFLLQEGERPWFLECCQQGPRATRQAGKISRRNQPPSYGKRRLMYPAAPQGRVAVSGQGEASVAPDSTARWSRYCSQGYFKTKLFWILVPNHECTHSSKTSFEQEHNIIPGHSVYTRWPKYMKLNTSSLTLKEARNSNKHSLREIKLPKSMGLQGS